MADQAIFIAYTPFSGVPVVRLMPRTWKHHITEPREGHPELVGKEHLLQTTLECPTAVYSNNGDNEYVVFSNNTIVNVRGSPLAVIVSPEAQIVVTSYYERRLVNPDVNGYIQIWQPA